MSSLVSIGHPPSPVHGGEKHFAQYVSLLDLNWPEWIEEVVMGYRHGRVVTGKEKFQKGACGVSSPDRPASDIVNVRLDTLINLRVPFWAPMVGP